MNWPENWRTSNIEGCGASADTPTTRGHKDHRGYILDVFVVLTRCTNRLCSQEHGGDGRGSDAEAAASRTRNVTSLFGHSFRFFISSVVAVQLISLVYVFLTSSNEFEPVKRHAEGHGWLFIVEINCVRRLTQAILRRVPAAARHSCGGACAYARIMVGV